MLLDRAGGNPLNAEQFARMLVERGEVEGLAFPESVQALVAARIDTLRPELKALLHDAAVVGRVFWSGAVASVGGRRRDDVRRDLNELVRREFVRPVRVSSVEGEDELSFWHVVVRDVAYQQIPRSPRAEKHVAAARWVEQTSEDRLADRAEILVHHYVEAVELARAAGEELDVEKSLVRALLLAGERAAQLDTEAAERHFRRALELARDERTRARVLAELAPVLGERGDVSEAIEAYEEAIAVLRTSDPPAAAVTMNRLALMRWTQGEVSRTSLSSRRGLAACPSCGGRSA